MSEWDPWKRFERERERRMWDPWARLEYERERYRSDPWYRFKRDRERYYTDPFYRFERDMDRLTWDPWYRELKRREWKYDNGAMFRDRVLSMEERGDVVVLGRGESGGDGADPRFRELWERAKIEAWADLYGPSWWDYLKVIVGLGFAGWLIWLGWSLMHFSLPFP